MLKALKLLHFYFRTHRLLIMFIGFLILLGCTDPAADETDNIEVPVTTKADTTSYNADWTFRSHGKADADYDEVFPQDVVNTIEITIGSENWNSIRSNMKILFGYDFGGNNGGGGSFPDEETDYVDITMKYNSKTWKNVGFRLKGNSSLAQAWGQGNYKLPFKLNFDKFEEEYPAITNQQFYGFEELSFSPSFRDQSLMREKMASDIFRLAGITAAQTAFYRVYIDFGAGLKYCGVYTAVEIPEDNMIKTQFGEKDGNVYKPESRLASFVQSEFEKKNNEELADYSDVQAFVSVLNSSLFSANPVAWREGLQATFDIDHYLKYLAVNNAIVNWDSYGNMAHNYYLYNHSVNKLTWIPWDHNESLSGSPGITGTASNTGGPPSRSGLSLSMNEVSSSWPLLYRVAHDETYMATYKNYLKEFNEEVFTEARMFALIDKYYALIEPYAIGTNGEQSGYTYLSGSSSFTSAVTALKTHITNRRAVINSY